MDGSKKRIGPMPQGRNKEHKRLKTTQTEEVEADLRAIALGTLPCAKRYEKSFMHRETITHVGFAKTNFAVTASEDGVIKFWKRQVDEKTKKITLEFAKQFKAHKGALSGFALSREGTLFASASDSDKSIRFFDVVNFDMTLYAELDYLPYCCEWIHSSKNSDFGVLAVTHSNQHDISLYSGDSTAMKKNLDAIHQSPVVCLKFNAKYRTVVSCDEKGLVEYWSSAEPFAFSGTNLDFSLKTETDLYVFLKAKAFVCSVEFSPNFEHFVTLSSDMKVRVWDFRSAKILRVFDEDLRLYESIQTNAESRFEDFLLESFDFGQRAAKESARRKEMKRREFVAAPNAIFDESGRFVLFGSIVGVKVCDIETGKCERILGKEESSERFLALALSPSLVSNSDLSAVLSINKNAILSEGDSGSKGHQILICNSVKRNRFYIFSREEPREDEGDGETGRDVINERPEGSVAELSSKEAPQNEKLPSRVVLRTSLGDIEIALFPQRCPKTVENFVGLVKKKYYDGVIFHRIVENFIIQTGDPTGTGRGGSSLWGGEFPDEIQDALRHDNPGVVSMANAGPDTNGSQFFFTLRTAPWLDGKHTVFGRVERGMDVVFQIGRLKVDKNDRPKDPPHILNAAVVENE